MAPFEKKAVEQAADMIPEVSLSGTPEKIREKVATLEALGVTEIAYQPAGPDIEGELQRMAEALSR